MNSSAVPGALSSLDEPVAELPDESELGVALMPPRGVLRTLETPLSRPLEPKSPVGVAEMLLGPFVTAATSLAVMPETIPDTVDSTPDTAIETTLTIEGRTRSTQTMRRRIRRRWRRRKMKWSRMTPN